VASLVDQLFNLNEYLAHKIPVTPGDYAKWTVCLMQYLLKSV